MMDTRFSSNISVNWLKHMYAPIAKHASHKLVTFKRHAKTCAQGRTIIDCRNERVKVPQTAYEKAFYNYSKAQTSASSIRWIERTSKLLTKHINHALCGHGGERLIVGAPVDGYDPTTKTALQYQGCHWHGCRRCFPNDRDEVVNHIQTQENCFCATVERKRALPPTALSRNGSVKIKKREKFCYLL